MSLPDFFDLFRFGPPVSQLFPFIFLSLPDFPDCLIFSASAQPSYNCSLSCSCHLLDVFPAFRFFRIRTTRLTIFPFHAPVISGFFQFFRFELPVSQLFLSFPDFFDLFRFGPPVSQLFPFIFLSLPDFPDCLIFSASAQPSYNCSLSCSCHLLDVFPAFRFFRIRTTRLTIFPFHAPVISGFFQFFRFELPVSQLFLSFPDFSGFLRCGPPISQLITFVFLSSLDFSDVFRLGTTHLTIVPFMIVSLRIFPIFSIRTTGLTTVPFHVPVISGFFRLFAEVSGRDKIDRASCFLGIGTRIAPNPDCSEFPDLSARDKVDRALCCLKIEAQRYVLLGVRLLQGTVLVYFSCWTLEPECEMLLHWSYTCGRLGPNDQQARCLV